MKPVKKTICSSAVHEIKARLRRHSLHTVCEEARCPNLGECFERGTATFMILGDICTRSCGFCGVKQGGISDLKSPAPLDPEEPERVAKMVGELGLKHVVVTSVTRDDLPDEGAGQFVSTIKAILGNKPSPTIEVLTPDFHARTDCLKTVCDARPDIFNHNLETVRRLTPVVRSVADYDTSLAVLKWVRENYPSIAVKSGIMVGLGETEDEVKETLDDLCGVGCATVTVGQYLRPSKKNLSVVKYLDKEAFEKYKALGEKSGIKHMFCGSFVRSSYMAENFK